MSSIPLKRLQVDTDVNQETGITFIKSIMKRSVGRPRNSRGPKEIVLQGKMDRASLPHVTNEFLFAEPISRMVSFITKLIIDAKLVNIVLQFRENGLCIIESMSAKKTAPILSVFLRGSWSHYYHCKTPINIVVPWTGFVNMLRLVKPSSHFVKFYLNSESEIDKTVALKTMFHAGGEVFDTMVKNEINCQVIDYPVYHLPIYDYYPLVIDIDSAILRNFIANRDITRIRFCKSNTIPLEVSVCRPEHDQMRMNISESFIIHNSLAFNEVLTVEVATVHLHPIIDGALTYTRANILIALHPTESTIIVHELVNRNIRTQFEIPAVPEQHTYIKPCQVCYVIPRSEAQGDANSLEY